MEIKSFKRALNETSPPKNLSPALLALWYAGNKDWQRAHEIVQEESSADCAWVHALLHRQEGDYGNACYWYARAKENAPPKSADLQDEWDRIVEALLVSNT